MVPIKKKKKHCGEDNYPQLGEAILSSLIGFADGKQGQLGCFERRYLCLKTPKLPTVNSSTSASGCLLD